MVTFFPPSKPLLSAEVKFLMLFLKYLIKLDLEMKDPTVLLVDYL